MRFTRFALLAALLPAAALVGCADKEEKSVINVDTPAGSVSVEGNDDEGTVSIDVDEPGKKDDAATTEATKEEAPADDAK